MGRDVHRLLSVLLASIQSSANSNCEVICVCTVHRDDQGMDVTVTWVGYDWKNQTVERMMVDECHH